ncbi:cytidylyltransferase domain-containing protein [Kordiimonas sp.]|uniref:acylneuraminate cytidylyltransferase family protein n=1 Tax=Kordiimonas sp. TaxID=1970157 RepID=UPI003A930881
MRPIAIIPARGQSKRIPKKNIVEFHGKPLIAWAIEAALESDSFAHVVVSTDCPEIAEVAKTCGADVPFLRAQFADDHSSSSEATCWTVERLVETLSIEPDLIVQLMANIPLRRAQTIAAFVEAFDADRSRSMISCFQSKFGPAHWVLERNGDGDGRFILNEFIGKRSQDLPPLFFPTGAIWGASWHYLNTHKSFYGPHFRLFEMSWLEALDIDTPDELEICRRLVDHREC